MSKQEISQGPAGDVPSTGRDRVSGIRDTKSGAGGAGTLRRLVKQRTAVEWTSLGISLAIIFGILLVTLFLYVAGGDSEAVIDVSPRISDVREDADQYYLPISVENTGGRTAESVIVEVTLATAGGQEESAEVTFEFLAGRSTQDAVVAFSEDPRNGDLSTRVKSYLEP